MGLFGASIWGTVHPGKLRGGLTSSLVISCNLMTRAGLRAKWVRSARFEIPRIPIIRSIGRMTDTVVGR
jgi:hypothetical protein